ncbi:hypothetical protein [Hydrogenobaculum phage 1]|uniref:hypothetical protein n=1 Tax=Hydrogenobaculum phage 1 TaxID=1732176 RepID=UPI00070584B1|nr:hypothetical protein AUR69_gp05 [Hydrogenobaculum phage 1]ALG96916.1 hypothetical protein [Hydrogenobaculum phage 1]
MPKQKKATAPEQNPTVKTNLAGSVVSILIGILANMKNFLYVYTTSLSAYLFYEAMQKDVMFTLPVLGFLAISYFPLFYRRRSE